MNIIGYSYEAALHCVDCARERFPLLPNVAFDREGNQVRPVFSTDEPGDSGDYCDDCHVDLRK